ncbi:hypothetical protein [Halobacillus litoralis]|uniref:hypothetical protein n=1 Tax=Halobacillus litoralis TaxID=45668 RepID=UPI001CFF2CA1|nr:hypothetical protein [Halobacillus litoralis]
MKKVRLSIVGLIAVLLVAIFFYLDNRELNALINDRSYPMVEDPTQHPQPLTDKPRQIHDMDVHLTKLYSRNDAKGLYFGMWYNKRNPIMNNEEKDWRREMGEVEFLVKAVDSNGTTYNGKTNGSVQGTFTTFRYIQFDDFKYDDLDLEELHLSFYPIFNEGKKALPNEQPWMEDTIQVE